MLGSNVFTARGPSSILHWVNTATCPICRRAIPADDVNVATDVAFCRACEKLHKLSELASDAALDPRVDPSNPPAGAWHVADGMVLRVGASCRSILGALGLLLIAGFWNGVVSIFVLINIASTMNLLGLGVPDVFPAPKMNGAGMGVGITIFLWFFLTPFILIGAALIAGVLNCLFGRVEVTVRDQEGVAFSGIGGLGVRRRFDASAVRRVSIEDKKWVDSDGDRRSKSAIVIETQDGKRVRFGSSLPEERRRFVAGVLGKCLTP
ncbi:MAG: hypothetical protein U1D55_02215 [Phycisphaerae bacterium]